ncbi:Ankyrin repeat-containing protein [Glarea lozoyensis ATCC 20868]|uniref:Ankyrin repeat-containing protein n=2 Tax=Glarea lozoyensis TaxID=101852 RepID=S3DH91_GLAL2|nr:Ankyrin repeat-containing protein [Glarea lozoyensis ATCC 20868]EPE25948.1 Ankyrin repeat-containing protein [Glarea lozoyensis ATCC 20868]
MAISASEGPVEINIPALPSQVKDFIPYITQHPNEPIGQLLEPFKVFESELRKVYAQDPGHHVVQDGNVNLVPVFDGHEKDVKIRARDLEAESDEETSHYIMELEDDVRKATGDAAMVTSFKEFQQNFNLFSESSLIDLDWANVVAAGSSVTTALLPVPKEWSGSKRSMREYYHEHLAPASDVDLFLYGMNEEQALRKIDEIEKNVRDSILHEVTTIRTKNAITIASQYPTRHVQIVLRLYDSVSQIITGFDVDCACAAYDGKQVYAAPRALAAFMTQCNTIDLSRRSPSYENRLSKYSHRGFEVYWPLLDRSLIDPTIFERSFRRTQGLARLLILELLPKASDRDSYTEQRRQERGRPALNRWRGNWRSPGNLKDAEEDEVADWIEQEDVSSYHTMTVPYGPKYDAARINRLLYAKDLLLNAEWNQPKDREVYLHRHPCFFGTAKEVIQDCCGYCPMPKTDEEIEVAEEESKVYVSGDLRFLQDDPGRQEIGSFNPITDDEWTTMAYVGDTARLCQAIVDNDLEHVQDWCEQDGVDVNRRDYTGRTPLHLATMSSTPEIVQCLIDHGARLIARLVDGKTALHIAAARGNAAMVKALMDKSLENEAEEDEKKDAKREAKQAERKLQGLTMNIDDDDENDDDASSEPSEITLGSEDSDSMTMGSFVKVQTEDRTNDGVPEDSTDDPDIYEIDVIAWDYGLSPLHLAIMNGHLDIIELLVSEYGADVLLPVKLIDPDTKGARGAILTIVLTIFLPAEKSKEVLQLLLRLGATSSQGDMNQITAFHYLVAKGENELLDIVLKHDEPAARGVLNHLASRWGSDITSPLLSAIGSGNKDMASKLLSLGAEPTMKFEQWIKVYLERNQWAKNNYTSEQNMRQYLQITQPVLMAAQRSMGRVVMELIAKGADPATMTPQGYQLVQDPSHAHYYNGETLLDVVQNQLKELRECLCKDGAVIKSPETLMDETFYLRGLKKGTYKYFTALTGFRARKNANNTEWEQHNKAKEYKVQNGIEEKRTAIQAVIFELEETEQALLKAGVKPFYELHKEVNRRPNHQGFQYVAPITPPYQSTWTFTSPDMNEEKKSRYIMLFEAAWNGDVETVKSMTLAPWESGNERLSLSPLQIAIQDSNGFSPFSIAVLRGHRDLARRIIEICLVQYHKDDNKGQRQRWQMITENEEDTDDSDDDNEVLPIFSELVSDKFTVDNLGDVSYMVKSSVMPLTMINWKCAAARFVDVDAHTSKVCTLMEHAVDTDDISLLRFVIEIGTEQQQLLAEEDDDQKCFTIEPEVFKEAIRNGQTAMLAEMIESSGVGIPLNDMIKKSGIEIKTKPKHYQGLTVGGKKRADWAQPPNTFVTGVTENKIPPLLYAANVGSIESVEWFMSEAPMRKYRQFAENHKTDKRIKGMGEDYDKTIATWMRAHCDLILHCAILWNPDPKSEQNTKDYFALIKHVLTVAPETLEKKSAEGLTPLQIAVLLRRKDVIAYLLSVGANQRTRDREAKNVIHSLSSKYSAPTKEHLELIQEIINLFDRSAVKAMLLERTSLSAGALTPLAYWMQCSGNQYKKPDLISLLTRCTAGEELEIINGEGDLPLHVAVKKGWSEIASHFISLNPSLLYRENATGRTPLEMSRDMYISSCVSEPIQITDNYYAQSVIHRAPESFLPRNEAGAMNNVKRTYEICVEADQEMEGEGRERKRRLVSLMEANEVAERVTGYSSRYAGRQVVVNGGAIDDEAHFDILREMGYQF